MGIFTEVWLVFIVTFSVLWFLGRPLAVFIYQKANKGRKQNFELLKDIDGVSILVPCHNEETTIGNTIKSLMDQELPCEREIILIENNSVDETWRVLREWESEYPNLIKALNYKPKDNEYPISATLNHGLDHAKFSYIFRIDADTILEDKMVIQKSIEPIADGKAVTVASNVRILNFKQNLLTRFQGIEYFLSMEMDKGSQRLYKSVLCCSGAMQSFKTSVLRKIGGYNTAPQVPEDLDITWRLHKEGQVEMNRESIGYTDAPATIKELYKQRLHWMKLGVICMFMHKKGIGNKKYRMLGLVGIPVKIFNTVRSLIGLTLRLGLSFELATSSSFESVMLNYLWITFVHLGLYLMLIYIVRPVAFNKQGSDQWFLLPIFVTIYEPFLAAIRIIAIFTALKILILDHFGEKRFVYHEETIKSKEKAV